MALRRSAETPTCHNNLMIQPRPIKIRKAAIITRTKKCRPKIETLPALASMIASVMLADRNTKPPSNNVVAIKASVAPAHQRRLEPRNQLP